MKPIFFILFPFWKPHVLKDAAHLALQDSLTQFYYSPSLPIYFTENLSFWFFPKKIEKKSFFH
jgi:hypothetical protein